MTRGRDVIPANKKCGRPPHEPDEVARAYVEAMAGCGIPESDIAKVIKVDPKTLRKHYRDELDTGHIRANARVAQSLYDQATSGNVTAAIWWSKARMGWSEKTLVDHTSSDGAFSPTRIEIVAPQDAPHSKD